MTSRARAAIIGRFRHRARGKLESELEVRVLAIILGAIWPGLCVSAAGVRCSAVNGAKRAAGVYPHTFISFQRLTVRHLDPFVSKGPLELLFGSLGTTPTSSIILG